MLQEVAQHPGSGWLWLLQLFLSGRPIFLLLPPEGPPAPTKIEFLIHWAAAVRRQMKKDA